MDLARYVMTASALLVATAAQAGTPSDRFSQRFEARQERQVARVDAGIEAGRIGPREEAALGRQQTALDRAFDRQATDGGRLSVREARRLESRFDRGSRAIRAAGARPRG